MTTIMTTSIVIPKGDRLGTIDIKMSVIYLAEQRSDEIAIVNQHRAPELIALFARAYSIATENISIISSEVTSAKNAANKRRAVVILDVVPGYLKDKGLSNARSPGGSEDQRNAVLELDEEYITLRDTMQQLEAYLELMKGKQKHLEYLYMAVRKIIGDSMTLRNNIGSNFPSPNPKGDVIEYRSNEDVIIKTTNKENVPNSNQSTNNLINQFGKVR